MILGSRQIAHELENPTNPDDPLIITPKPDLEELKNSGTGSVDIRLGCWFTACRTSRAGLLDVYPDSADVPNEAKLTKSYDVPFGEEFVLHPKAFVLGVTLEWIRLPVDRAGYVIGRSSWGRHGLIIATATGVHPGFTGCLTLELSNVGEIPIKVKPGTTICQIFLHQVQTPVEGRVCRSSFIGRRKPVFGAIKLDERARKLASRD